MFRFCELLFLLLISTPFVKNDCPDPNNCYGIGNNLDECASNGNCFICYNQFDEPIPWCWPQWNGQSCVLGSDCGPPQCVCSSSCTPLTSCPGYTCGEYPDGCGGYVYCGSCSSGSCSGSYGTCTCSPLTSCPGYTCGEYPDGCGGY